jgi:hypothetical protein
MNTTLKIKCVQQICFEIEIAHIQHFRLLIMHYAYILRITYYILPVKSIKLHKTHYTYYIAHYKLQKTYNN